MDGSGPIRLTSTDVFRGLFFSITKSYPQTQLAVIVTLLETAMTSPTWLYTINLWRTLTKTTTEDIVGIMFLTRGMWLIAKMRRRFFFWKVAEDRETEDCLSKEERELYFSVQMIGFQLKRDAGGYANVARMVQRYKLFNEL